MSHLSFSCYQQLIEEMGGFREKLVTVLKGLIKSHGTTAGNDLGINWGKGERSGCGITKLTNPPRTQSCPGGKQQELLLYYKRLTCLHQDFPAEHRHRSSQEMSSAILICPWMTTLRFICPAKAPGPSRQQIYELWEGFPCQIYGM